MITNISVDEMILNIKKITDLAVLNPTEIIPVFRAYGNMQEDYMMFIPREAQECWLRVLQFVRKKSKCWGTKLSENFIDGAIEKFIYQLKSDRKKYDNMNKSVIDWLDTIQKSDTFNFLFILPINNVEYRMDLNFGRIQVKKIKELKSLIPSDVQIGPMNTEGLLSDLISSNSTETFAIIEVQAKDEKEGFDLANLHLKRFVHTIRLFEPQSKITERAYYFPPTDYHYLSVNLNTNGLVQHNSSFHPNTFPIDIDQRWFNNTQYHDLFKTLTTFLFIDNPNEIQSIILTALYWYGDAIKETDDNLSKYLKCTYGLEKLLIFDKGYNKGRRIAERLSIIFADMDDEYYTSKDLLQRYYDERNNIVHAGKLYVDQVDLDMISYLLRELIFKYIQFSKKYTDITTMFREEYSIEL